MFPRRPMGVYPPVVTPLDDEERLDVEGFERQIERLIAANVHGIYLLGSSGEWVTLRDDVRWQAGEAAVRIVADRVPLLACVMDTSTERVLDNAARMRDHGIHAIATTPPFYYPPFDENDILRFFETVARRAKMPLFIYNIPSTTKVMMTVPVISELAKIDNIIGIKDSSGNWVHTVELLDAVGERDDFVVFIGSHVLAGGAILFGAHGAVMSLANIDPATCVRLYEAARKRDVNEVWRCTQRLVRLGQIYKHAGQIPCIKAALHMMGICGARATHPHLPLTAPQRDIVANVLRSLDLL